jgi:NAD-dependent dihydropyrimidine dehydrogenase PreA subunit
MAFVILSACIDVKDQSCAAVCPVDCIYVEAEDRMCYIHPTECIDCAVCVEACPVAAIKEANDLAPAEQVFQAINAEWFDAKTEARQKIDALKPRDV